MTFRAYKKINISARRLDEIQRVNQIIEKYAPMGLRMSVRQIYYQLVGMDAIPNDDLSYGRLQTLINDGRMVGAISWDAIEDRNRELRGLRTWRHPRDAIKEARENYRIDKWVNQVWRPEVWSEKAAQEGTVGQICDKLQVDYMSLRGYNSQSMAWEAGQRFQRYLRKGQRPIVFHLGDLDYSGWDMTRDNRERIEMFTGTPVIVQRLALNMDQVDELGLPPNPGKQKDGRKEKYFELFNTTDTYEMDALPPEYIQKLIEDAILKIRDEKRWDDMLAEEVNDKLVLDGILENMGTDDDVQEPN